MVQLGAVTASALDSGASTAMAFDGQLLSRPASDGREIAVSDALMHRLHRRVRPAAGRAGALAERRRRRRDARVLSYRSCVRARCRRSLVGPDGTTIPIDSGARTPGTYRFTWTGTTATSTPAREGLWRFSVTATDDQGQVSQADRTFALNNTLASLARAARRRSRCGKKGTRLLASFTLAHAAKVTATVETAAGRRRPRPGAQVARAPAGAPVSGTAAPAPATLAYAGLVPRPRLRGERARRASTCTRPSQRAGRLAPRAARERHELADDVRPRPRPLRGLRPDGDRRRPPRGERARDGRRRRASPRARSARRSPSSGPRSRTASGRTSPSRSPERSATSSARSSAGGSACYGGRPLLERHGRWFHLDAGAARARRGVVRPLRRLGGAPRPRHARRALVRVDSGRGLPRPVRALRRADAHRLGDLVLRARGRRLGARLELRELPPRVRVRRNRGRCRNSRRHAAYLVLRRRRATRLERRASDPTR